MLGHDIVVVGASAGGVEALIRLVGALPESLPAAVFITLHIPASLPSVLPAILSRSGPLAACHAEDGKASRPGHIYVAPPDQHLLLEDGVMRLSHGPRENGSRPSIDVMFRSAARVYGPRVAGLVLSGTLYDGTGGLVTIKQHGGATLVQDPADARHPSMPQNAISGDHPDYVLPLLEIAETLVRLASGRPPQGTENDAGTE